MSQAFSHTWLLFYLNTNLKKSHLMDEETEVLKSEQFIQITQLI